MYLHSVRLRNFLLFEDAYVEFGKFNILLGDNGSGKSSVGVALEIVRKWVNASPRINDEGRFERFPLDPPLAREISQCIRRSEDNPSSFSIALVFCPRTGQENLELTMSANLDATTGLLDVDGTLLSATGDRRPPHNELATRRAIQALRRVRVNDHIVRTELSGDDPNLFALRDDSGDDQRFSVPTLSDLGHGVARFMAFLQHWSANEFTADGRRAAVERMELARKIRMLVPWAHDFKADSQGRTFSLLDDRNVEFPASRLSSGELRLVGLACMLSRTEIAIGRETFLFVEEPELGLSPRAISELTTQFKRMEAQLIVTTHSPWVPFSAVYGSADGDPSLDSIIVVRRADGASTFCRARDQLSDILDGTDLGLETIRHGVPEVALGKWRALMDSEKIG